MIEWCSSALILFDLGRRGTKLAHLFRRLLNCERLLRTALQTHELLPTTGTCTLVTLPNLVNVGRDLRGRLLMRCISGIGSALGQVHILLGDHGLCRLPGGYTFLELQKASIPVYAPDTKR